jgi:hypothetical protein
MLFLSLSMKATKEVHRVIIYLYNDLYLCLLHMTVVHIKNLTSSFSMIFNSPLHLVQT